MRIKHLGLNFILTFAVIGSVAFWLRSQIEAVEVGVDDANIFFVYARNLILGRGLVWNVGGPHVEGFSSPLWLMLIAPFFKISANPEFLLFLLSSFLLTISLAVTLHLLNLSPTGQNQQKVAPPQRPDRSPWALLLILWLFAQPMYLMWTTQTLMETGLWSSVILLSSCLAALSATHPAPSVYMRLFRCTTPLIVLARPEGMMWAGVLLTAEAAGAKLAGFPLKDARRRFLASFALYGFVVITLTVARLLYFGYPFPNTYYAKVSPDRAYNLQSGWSYAAQFFQSQRALPAVAICALALALTFCAYTVIAPFRRTSLPPTVITAFIFSAGICTGLLTPILVGGDHFDGFRFYQPIWPMLLVPPLLLARTVSHRLAQSAPVRWARVSRAVFVVSALAFLFGACFPDVQKWKNIGRSRLVDEFRLAHEGREIGKALNRILKAPFVTVGAIAVGGIQYTYGGPINDLMGLSNIEMAHYPGDRKGIKNHAAFSKEVFYRQQPEIMIPILLPFHAAEFVQRSPPIELARYINNRWVLGPLQGLPQDAKFRSIYTLCLISRADAQKPESIGAFVRQDFLEFLRSDANYVIAIF